MSDCKTLVTRLHNWGLSDNTIAELCGMSRIYIHFVRHGRKQGSNNLYNKLVPIYNKAVEIIKEDEREQQELQRKQ